MNAQAEAEALLREAIAVGEQVLGPGTLTVANLVNNLAVTLTSLGRHADAELAFRDALERHEAILGENHWRIRNLARNVGVILALQQRFEEALPWMDRALLVPMKASHAEGAGHQGVRAQRAWIVFQMGRRDEALADVTGAVSALEHFEDANDGYPLAFSRILHARMLTRMGRPEEAESAARAALAWFERWGHRHPKYADAECELGRAQVLRGFTAEGRARLERCLPIYRVWGQADREVVESVERLLADSTRPSPP